MRYIKNQTSHQTFLAARNWLRGQLLGKRGSVAILVGFSAPLLVLACAVAIEASGWTVTKLRLQRAADMAAITGALAYSNGASISVAATEAAYVAEVNGGTGSASRPPTWTAGASSTGTVADNQVTVQVNAGVKYSTDRAFIATVQTTVPFLFSSIYLHGAGKSLSASATAEFINQPGKYCVLTLDPSAATSVSTAGAADNNGGTVDLSACGIQVNSSGADALDMAGGALLKAISVSIVGNYALSNGASMTVTGSTTTGASPLSNPYASVSMPTPGTCAATNSFISGQTIPAGTYCNGLTVQYGTVTMGAGTIIVNGGNFTLEGGATVNATNGSTVVLTGSTGSSVGTAQIANGTTLNLTAPSSGTYAGIAIIQNSSAGTTASNLAGGTSVNITGAMVFPSSIVDFSNGSSNTAACTQLVAYQVVFEGGTRFGNTCAGIGTKSIGAPAVSVNLVQ